MTATEAARPLVLRLYPDPVLRSRCRPLRRTGRNVEGLARDMLALMRQRQGIGLAAPQVGLGIRLVVAEADEVTVSLVDPVLSPCAEAGTAEEGCLSLPGVFVAVPRPTRVEVRGRAPGGRRLHFEAGGLLARALQHEVDHLDGVLIIDRGPPVRAGAGVHAVHPRAS